MFVACFVMIWLVMTVSAVLAPDRMRKTVAYIAPVCFLCVLGWMSSALLPWQRLLCTTIGLLYTIKAIVLLRYSRAELARFSLPGVISYMTVWPGMDPEPLRARSSPSEDGKRFARGFVFAVCGLVAAALTALYQPVLGAQLTGWLGIASLLMIVHFGYADVLTTSMRLGGWNVGPLFEEPLKSNSLRDFWSRRWNLAFVQMDKILFVKPLTKLLGTAGAVFAVFVISGALHDLCISYSSGGGWGQPTLYFVLNGAAVLLERKLFKGNAHPALSTIWTWGWLILPLPLLFTPQFRQAFILPLFDHLHQLVASHDAQWYVSMALWCAAGGHFLTLGAGLQVPFRLNWKEELARLSSFNRKIFLNYAAYVGLMIVSFGTLTILLHDEMLRGDKAAVYLSVLIGIFWGVRVLVDYLYFGDKDWPEGPMFAIGHTCLNTLFIFLTMTYLGVAAWHLVIR